MDRSGLRRSQRKLFAQAQMIVMRADHDIFRGLAGQVRGHIVHRFTSRARHPRRVHLQRFGKRKRARLQILIDARSISSGFLPRPCEPRLAIVYLHLHKGNPGIAGPAVGPNSPSSSASPRMRRDVVHQNHAARAMHLGVRGLLQNVRVSVRLLPSKTLLSSNSCGSCRRIRTILSFTSMPA